MDTKESSDAPPSYDSIQHTGTSSASQDGSHSESATWHLQHHVASLPSRIRASQRARTAQQKLDDTLLVDHIAPAIEEFLIDLGAEGTATTPSATLTIVPDDAIPKKAELSGLEEMRKRGEIGRVSRVSLLSGKTGDGAQKQEDMDGYSNSTSFPTFAFSSASTSSDNANLLWWRDEAMARRLAGCLQPKAATGKKKQQQPERKSVVQTSVEKELPPEKQRKSWGWGRWRNGGGGGGGRGTPGERAAGTDNTPGPHASEVVSDLEEGPQQQGQGQVQDGAQMIVEAQEVAFRVENDLGILESIRGWSIVVSVNVN